MHMTQTPGGVSVSLEQALLASLWPSDCDRYYMVLFWPQAEIWRGWGHEVTP